MQGDRRWAGRLPPAAVAKLQTMLDANRDLHAALRSAAEDERIARSEVDRIAAYLAPMEEAEARKWPRPSPDDPPHGSLAAGRHDHAAALADLDRVRARRSRLEERLSTLAPRLQEWAEGLPADTALRMHQAPPPKLANGETERQAIEACRDRIAQLRADVEMVRAAPLPSAVVKERMRREVAALAGAGVPNVTTAIERGGRIKWPETVATGALFGRADDGSIVQGNATIGAPDGPALLAWLFKDALIAKLDATIDEFADDANALSDETRTAREAELGAAILEQERIECALIEAAAKGGMTIRYRDDVSPEAVLGVEIIAPDAAAPEPTGLRRLLPGRRSAA